jgi:hypothetical protein
MDEREIGSQPPVIILDHFSFTLTFVSWVGRGSFPTEAPIYILRQTSASALKQVQRGLAASFQNWLKDQLIENERQVISAAAARARENTSKKKVEVEEGAQSSSIKLVATNCSSHCHLPLLECRYSPHRRRAARERPGPASSERSLSSTARQPESH